MRLAILALTVGGALAVGPLAFGQMRPGSDEVIVPPTRTHPTVTKSDQHRVVGKVVAVDRARGTLKLSTEDEGVVDAPAPAMMLAAVRVGDTVSVARSGSGAPSASPR
jgi:hypothetical protein